MSVENSALQFAQIHIDAARNSTDDFNPFHDPYKWNQIHHNPFSGPIALGFQLTMLADYRIQYLRKKTDELALLNKHHLRYANYQFSFSDTIQPGERFQLEIKPTSNRVEEAGYISNRVLVRKDKRLVILGFQRDSNLPLVLPHADLTDLPDLSALPDRSMIAGQRFFLKRKFMNNSNAKNFLAGSLADQHFYFDELQDRVRYPEMFPAALLSCALLEKAHLDHYDFFRRPMVYTHHNISVDRKLIAQLKSNDKLHLLVEGPKQLVSEKGLGKSDLRQVEYCGFGLLSENKMLFRASLKMALLEDVVRALATRSAEKRDQANGRPTD